MRVAVLGCGNMGRAVISGLLKRYNDVSIIAYDKNEAVLKFLPDEVLVVSPDEWGLEENLADVIVLAVKPQDMASALSAFSAASRKKRVLCSCRLRPASPLQNWKNFFRLRQGSAG